MNAAVRESRARRRPVRALAATALVGLAMGALGSGTAVATPSVRPAHALVVAPGGDDRARRILDDAVRAHRQTLSAFAAPAGTGRTEAA